MKDSDVAYKSEGPRRGGCCGLGSSTIVYSVAVIGALLIMGWMSSMLIDRTKGPVVDHKRGEQRLKDAQEVRQLGKQSITTYGWQDQGKEIVRIPIDRSMELMVQEWKNPQEGRAKLLSRAVKANEVPSYE